MKVGVDLGGTKTEAILIDGLGNELKRIRRPTPANDYHAIIKVIKEISQEITNGFTETYSIGIGIPGAISLQTGLIKNANTTCLIGKPLKDDLELALGQKVRIANDANCFALSEATDGAAKDCKSVFAVILGTGVGGSLVYNKEIIVGQNAIAGEWGHNSLPFFDLGEEEQPSCYCGRKRCIETFLSGPAFSHQYQILTGKQLSVPEIIQSEDRASQRLLSLYTERLAASLAHVINIFDPEVIVLGGGMSNITQLYQEVPKIWSKFVFSDFVETRLAQNVHGDSSGVRGAAWLW